MGSEVAISVYSLAKAMVGSCSCYYRTGWFTTLIGVRQPIQPPLREKIKSDVLIVGGGAAGLSAALRLAGTGLKVVLLERSICGGSSTGKSAGFLTPDSELELSQLMRRFGKQGAKDLWDVPVRGVARMLSIITENGMECDLQKQDSLFLGRGRGGLEAVREEVEARKTLGYESTFYGEGELRAIIGSEGYSGCVRYRDTYGIDGLRYAQGVKKALLQRGVQVYESSELIGFSGHTATTHLGAVTADQVIFCADKLSPDLSRYSWNVYHEQTFLSITEPLSEKDRQALFPEESLSVLGF